MTIRRAKHRGIVLGVVHMGDGYPARYCIRSGRERALCTVAGLSREWLDVYVDYFRALGAPEKAMRLKAEWLAAHPIAKSGPGANR